MKHPYNACRPIAGMALALLLLGGCRPSTPASSPATGNVQAEVRALLDEQAAAWNRGDLDGFMTGYARTDSLRFASGGSVHHGWRTTLDRYRRAYPDRAAMGTLAFDRVDVRVLSPRWALVFGRWRLERAHDAPEGLFTLLIERRAHGWRIVHDHTSSAQ